MKKTICLLLVLLLLCLSACSQGDPITATTVETTTPAAETQPHVETAPPAPTGFTFSTTTLDGEPVTQEIFEGYKLILLNFWEPWCGPCVGEMPDLERIYQTLKDKGLLILGISYTQDGTAEVISQTGVTYPLLQYTDEFYPLTTAYVPTTVFMNAAGEQLTPPTPGAHSYEAWLSWINELLAQ